MANQKPYDHLRFTITLFLILNFSISQTTSIPSRISLESKPSVTDTSKEQISCTMCSACDNPCQPPPSPPPPVVECPPPPSPPPSPPPPVLPPPSPPPVVPICPPPPKPPSCETCFQSPPSDTGNIYPPPAGSSGGGGGGGGAFYPPPRPGNYPFDHPPPTFMVPYFPYYNNNPSQPSLASHSLLDPLSKIIILASSLLLLRF